MKTKILIFLCSLLFITLSTSLLGQDFSDDEVLSKQEIRELKKQEKRNAQIRKQALIDSAIVSQRFIIRANYISNKTGEKHVVSQSLNFISIDSLQGSIQIGSNIGIGSNGLGGITLDGDVRKYKLTYNEKKKSYKINLLLSCLGGAYDILITVNPDAYGTATISGLTGGFLTFYGTFEPLQGARVYKGKAF